MAKQRESKGSVPAIAITAVVMAVILVANYFAWSYMPIITQFMGQSMQRVIGESEGSVYFESVYENLDAAQVDEALFAIEVQAEGSVLLKNCGLPLASEGKITFLASRSAKDFFLVSGGGSGSINTSKVPSLKEVFEDAGYTVNPVMWDFYTSGGGKSTVGSSHKAVGEPPVSNYSSVELESLDDYNDAAIVVIGRAGPERREGTFL